MGNELQKPGGSFYKRKAFLLSLAGLCLLMAGILISNIVIIRRAENARTMSAGQIQLAGITTEVESNLYQAECIVESMAGQVEQLLSDERENEAQLQEFVKKKTKYVVNKTDGICFSVYIAYKNKLYIEGFEPGADWILDERTWYTGAKKKQGEVYITSPYIDANTGKMCYSVSMQLGDGETVVSVDYYMDRIQKFIEEMNQENGGISIIVNDTGMIIGHSDAACVGQDYSELSNADIVRKVFSLYGDSFVYQSGGEKYNVFSDKTSYNWYLIVCVDSRLVAASVSNEFYWIVFFIALLAVILIAFYIYSYRNKAVSEQKLAGKDAAFEKIRSEWKHYRALVMNQGRAADGSDWGQNNAIEQIQMFTKKMSGAMESLLSETMEDRPEEFEEPEQAEENHNHSFFVIVAILFVTSLITLGINTVTQLRWVDTKMQNEVKDYYYQTKEWVTENKKLVNTLAQAFSAQPELVEDYGACLRYLDDMVRDYEDVSVAYIVNPEWKHTVIMNNGWEPSDDWKVEERQWYLETMESKNENGFNVSTPYLDEQTGYYCVTLSQIVYDKKGDQIGILGIDYYMDKLIDILGESYSDNGYAFLVDMDYNILNHPYEPYQMTAKSSSNAGSLSYRKVLASDKAALIRDYDGAYRLCLMQEEEVSGFSVIVVKGWWHMYGNLVFSDVGFLLLFGMCVIIVVMVMRRLDRMQEQVHLELQMAADSANAASKAKGDFLAQMSHEIRTPINAVLGMNEMILRESENEEILEYAQNIQSAGRTLLNLINSILDFSKIEDGKMEIVPVEYDTASLINDLVHMILDKAEKKNLVFALDIDPGIPKTMYGDDVRVRQVITNLLTNAVKYTQEGTVSLKIAGEKQPQGDEISLYVEVKDTGMGIREEDMEKLFQSFQRLDMKKNRNVEGTGLGISIVQKLLVLMGSKLEVHSVYGQGSVFSFTLSQKIVSAEPIGDYKKRMESNLKKAGSETFLYAPQAKILLVDDYPLNLKVAKGLLKRCGIKPDTALSGSECLEKVQNKHYDIIFLDHMMPEMDGIETLHRLKDERSLPEKTKVIMMTANAVAGAREEYLKEGFDNYLSKPIEIDQMEKQLKKYLPKEIVSFKTEEKRKRRKKPEQEETSYQEGMQKPEGGELSKPQEGLEQTDVFGMPGKPQEGQEQEDMSGMSGEPELYNPEEGQEQTDAIDPAEEEFDDLEILEPFMDEDDEFTEEEIAQMKEQIPGLHVEEGLAYSMDSKSFYLSVIEDYAKEDKETVLGQYLDEGDMEQYAVVIHSLKGATRMVGLKEMAALAEALQKAAEKADIAFVKENHAEFIKQYLEVKQKFKQFLK